MNNNFIRHTLSIASKETYHIKRDPFTLAVAFLLPLFFVIVFGYIIDLDYKHMPVLVNDNDKTPISRLLRQEAKASNYFDIKTINSPYEADKLLNKNSTKALIVITKGFGRNITSDKNTKANIQILVDGTDNAGAAMLSGYVKGIFSTFLSRISKQNGIRNEQYLSLRTRYLFNPDLNSKKFIIPALNTIIIGFLAIVLTAVTVAKEWENGSMELLLATPVKPAEIIIGKLLPYAILAFIDCIIIFCLALILFKLPFNGSFTLYLIACVLYIIGALGLGLLISVATRQQQAAIQFAMAIGLLPSIIFSGFIFPIENMPIFFQYLTVIFPQRWFLYISRSLFLSSPNLLDIGIPFLALLIFAIIMTSLAIKKFKTNLEP